MQKYCFVIGLFWVPVALFSQGFSYQAAISDGNTLIINSIIEVEFTIINNDNGVKLYEESHVTNTNDQGVFQVYIGEGNPKFGQFDQIDWSSRFLALDVRISRGGAFDYLGRNKLSSVPSSNFAKRAGSLDKLSITDSTSAGGDISGPFSNFRVQKIQGQTLNLSNPGVGQVLKWTGTEWAPDLDISSSIWDQNGSDISFSIGNVSIGTDSSIAPLTIGGEQKIVNSNNHSLIELGSTSFDQGDLKVLGPKAVPRIQLTSTNINTGWTGTFHTNGKIINQLTSTSINKGGLITVSDTFGVVRAGMGIDSFGDGIIFGGVKNFRMQHPQKENKEIWYASLEGPEAGAYIRGTANLINGQATVNFPEHFSLVVNPAMMTVTVTPLSAQSNGLAIVSKTKSGFDVVELMDGKGSYSFDWIAMAVRSGYEDFKVIRDKMSIPVPQRDK